MADFHVKIISSNRTFYEGVCHCLILPAVDGEMAVMAHHESEIDRIRAQEALERAKERLRQKQSISEYYSTRAAMARALVRLKETEKFVD